MVYSKSADDRHHSQWMYFHSRAAWVLLVLFTVLVTPVRANDSGSPSGSLEVLRTRANEAFEDGRWADAVPLFEELYRRNPDHWQSAFRLAHCKHLAGDFEGSIQAHREAAKFPPARPASLFNIACANAQLGRTDEAISALTDAIEAGYDDLESIRTDPELASIQSDPRLEAQVEAAFGDGGDLPPLTYENLAERLEAEERDGASGALLVLRDGQPFFREAFGLANREKGIPVNPRTIFAIGSTPIDFTRASILLLAQRGKLKLEDSVTRYFDNVPSDKTGITLWHLMSGQSGLRDFHDLPGDRDPDHAWIDRDEAIRRIWNHKLLFAPGEGEEHSHSAWGVLAAVVEIVSGQTYPEFTREHLFGPAGMNDTGFFGEPIPEERLAIGYGDASDGKINAPPYWGRTSWLVMGSGGQTSTIDDMHRWHESLRSGRILEDEWLDLYWAPPGALLVGGDMFGFEIAYMQNPQDTFILMSNAVPAQRQRSWRRLIDDLVGLAAPPSGPMSPYTLGISIGVEAIGVRRVFVITGVAPESAAQEAGLETGDEIHAVDDVGTDSTDLVEMLQPALRDGRAVVLTIHRDGEPREVTVQPRKR